MEIKKYKNEVITVNWEPEKCIHSRLCFKGLPQVFNPNKKPWVTIQGDTTEAIVNQINKCPSGALSYTCNKEELNGKPDAPEQNTMLKVNVSKAGPLLIHGSFILEKENSEIVINAKVTALCRCGQSQNKPYCDGSHKTIDFDTPL